MVRFQIHSAGAEMDAADQKAVQTRGVSIALAVLALGLSCTLAAWHVIRGHERAQIRWATELAADAIRIDVTTDIEWQVFGLDRLALLWKTAGQPSSLWTKNADLYIQHRPGCIAVEWLAPTGVKKAIMKAPTRKKKNGVLALDGLPQRLLDAAATSKTATISTPLLAPDGSKQYAIAYPVYENEQLKGYVVSFFDFERSLSSILNDVRRLGFSVELWQGDEHQFLLQGSTRQYEQAWATTANIPVPGGTWSLRVWPNPGVLDRIKSLLPEAMLVIGTVLSILIAVIVYLGVHATQVNSQLASEVSRRSEAQEQLSRAHAELETRVRERTAELATTNVTLEREIEEHQRAEDSLQKLTAQMFSLQDEERRRLARELHDGTTQNLVALALNVAAIKKVVPDTCVHERELLNDSVRLIDQSTDELRTISYLLHPPLLEDLGLIPALQSYVDGFSERSGIQVHLELDSQVGRLGKDVELDIFRIVQESLANIHRHSQSRVACLALLREDGGIRLEITDEGRGIHPALLANVEAGMTGVGIAGMRQRVQMLNGKFEITSSDHGTCVRILVPLASPAIAVGSASS